MNAFTLQIITSSRKEITIQKDRETPSVRIKGFEEAEAIYSAEDARDLAALFAGVEKLLNRSA